MKAFSNFVIKWQLVCILLFVASGCVHSLNPEPRCMDFKHFFKKYKNYTGDLLSVYSFRGQCFNPNNSDEMIYYGYSGKTVNSNDTITIYKYNLQTHLRSKVVNVVGTPDFPQWGANDWIVFDGYGNKLYKVKSNGDSLTSLGSGYSSLKWSYNGDKIVGFSRVNYNCLSVLDKNGHIEDSTYNNNYTIHLAWNRDNIIALGEDKKVTFLQYPEFVLIKTITVLDKGEHDPRISGLEWIPNTSKFVWTCDLGIFITDYVTEQTQQIKEGCEINRYGWPSVSDDGTKLLVSRLEYRANKASKTIETFCNIYLMNIDGSEEEKLNLEL